MKIPAIFACTTAAIVMTCSAEQTEEEWRKSPERAAWVFQAYEQEYLRLMWEAMAQQNPIEVAGKYDQLIQKINNFTAETAPIISKADFDKAMQTSTSVAEMIKMNNYFRQQASITCDLATAMGNNIAMSNPQFIQAASRCRAAMEKFLQSLKTEPSPPQPDSSNLKPLIEPVTP